MVDTEPVPASRLMFRAIVLVAFVIFVVAIGFAVSHRASTDSMSFRVAKLRATVVEMGELASWDFHDKAYGVRLRATLCFDASARTVVPYPLEFQIAHYALSDPPSKSWASHFEPLQTARTGSSRSERR